MKLNYLLVVLVLFSVVVFGCTSQTQTSKNAGDDKKADGIIAKDDGTTFGSDGKVVESTQTDGESGTSGMGTTGYAGEVLAGTGSTKYVDFNKADYDKALKEKKKILLYFYANWCPLCKAEQPETFAAFNELNDSDLIGFRVNYKDSDTDDDEEALAKELGIAYQHTKVILKDKQKVLKAPDSWDRQRYLTELKKI